QFKSMATESEHQSKADHNLAFLGTIDSKRFPDWTVTVSFYRALHLVQVLLARKGHHGSSHVRRNRVLKTHFPPVWNDYRPLYSYSRIARYGCTTIDQAALPYIERRLHRVERTIGKLL